MKNLLLILNQTPYGNERSHNALRLAHTLSKNPKDARISVFLVGDAVACAKSSQSSTNGNMTPEHMLKSLIENGGSVLACCASLDARGLAGDELVLGVWQGTMEDMAEAILRADQVLTF